MPGEGWRWEYEPDYDSVAHGAPKSFIAQVEHLCTQLVELADTNVDITELGEGPTPTGLLSIDVAGGWFLYMVVSHLQVVLVVKVMPPFEDL